MSPLPGITKPNSKNHSSRQFPLKKTFCSNRNLSICWSEEKLISRETDLHFKIFFGTRAWEVKRSKYETLNLMSSKSKVEISLYVINNCKRDDKWKKKHELMKRTNNNNNNKKQKQQHSSLLTSCSPSGLDKSWFPCHSILPDSPSLKFIQFNLNPSKIPAIRSQSVILDLEVRLVFDFQLCLNEFLLSCFLNGPSNWISFQSNFFGL